MRFGRRLVAGAVAGAVGTAAMDLVWYRRYRRDGGKDRLIEWELASAVRSWEDASAPGRVGQKALRVALRREPPAAWARTTTNVVHWATGIGWGVQYGLLAGRSPRHPSILATALGPTAWASSYVLLPLAGVYRPIWEYDAKTLSKDLTAHLVFGAATSVAFRALRTTAAPPTTAGG
jgi:hypothetical protein